jgi:hypothetical protein
MTEEQAFALANLDGDVYAPSAFVLALGAAVGTATERSFCAELSDARKQSGTGRSAGQGMG